MSCGVVASTTTAYHPPLTSSYGTTVSPSRMVRSRPLTVCEYRLRLYGGSGKTLGNGICSPWSISSLYQVELNRVNRPHSCTKRSFLRFLCTRRMMSISDNWSKVTLGIALQQNQPFNVTEM